MKYTHSLQVKDYAWQVLQALRDRQPQPAKHSPIGCWIFRFDLHLQKYWKVRHYLIEKEWLFHLTFLTCFIIFCFIMYYLTLSKELFILLLISLSTFFVFRPKSREYAILILAYCESVWSLMLLW